MQLHLLSEANLRDRLFIQQYINAFKPETKALIVVAPFGGTSRDTRFVVRRLSTLLSEQLVYNNAFTGDQRMMIKEEDGELKIRTDFIQNLIQPLQALILGSMAQAGDEEVLVDGERLAQKMRQVLPIEETVVFPHNPMSPLSSKSHFIRTKEDTASLIASYEEEREAIELAARLSPSRLTGPSF